MDTVPEDFWDGSKRGTPNLSATIENAKTQPLFVVEFSANSNLRRWSRKLGTFIVARVYPCGRDPEGGDSFGTEFLSDDLGWIGEQGIELLNDKRTRAPANRYSVVVKRESSDLINGLISAANPLGRIETVEDDLCVFIEALQDTENSVRTSTMKIRRDVVLDAWQKFLSNGN